ncbi:MAG: YbaB/EbfC family nucleoid-associated protein [Fidelibacterota bacterium]
MDKIAMAQLLKQAKKFQEKLEKAQEELVNLRVESSAGGGMVTAAANGKQEILEIKIDPEVLKEDIEMIEDLIVAAVNSVLAKASEAANEQLSKATGGLLSSLPGGFKIPGFGL